MLREGVGFGNSFVFFVVFPALGGFCALYEPDRIASLPPKTAASNSQRAQRGILMPRGKNCRETIFAAQLPHNYPHHGVNFPKNLLRLFLRNNLTRLKITSEVKNNLKRLFLALL